MSKDSTFKKYYGKIAREGLLKSFLLALTVGLFTETAILFAFWFAGVKRIWLSVGISAGIVALLVPTFYFLFFRPTTRSMAKRLDSLGLEERLLTMNELVNDNSYIAMRQREDARQALEKINPKEIKFVLSKTLIVLLIVSFVTATSMTTVSALTNSGIIPPPDKIIDDITKNEVYYTVRYAGIDAENQDLSVNETPIEVGGMFEGLEEQLIAVGENGEPILAVSDPDWVFVCWGDGSDDPYRIEEAVVVDESVFDEFDELPVADGDNAVKRVLDVDRGWAISIDADGNISITVFAMFMEIGEGAGDGEGDGMSDETGEGDEGLPEEPSESDDKKDNESDSNDKSDNNDPSQDSGRPSDKDNNNIIDGKTDYKSRLEEYIAKAKEYQQNGQEIPDYLLELIEQYYDLIS